MISRSAVFFLSLLNCFIFSPLWAVSPNLIIRALSLIVFIIGGVACLWLAPSEWCSTVMFTWCLSLPSHISPPVSLLRCLWQSVKLSSTKSQCMMEAESAVKEFSRAIYTPNEEASCYGVAHWHCCYAGISVRGVAGCVTSGAIDPLQNDSFPQSSAALHMSIHAHPHVHKLRDHQQCCMSKKKNDDGRVLRLWLDVVPREQYAGVFICIRLLLNMLDKKTKNWKELFEIQHLHCFFSLTCVSAEA